MKNNLFVQMVYRIIMLCVSAFAVIFTLHIFYVGDNPHDASWYIFTQFTVISNWLVFASTLITVIENIKRVYAGERYGFINKAKVLRYTATLMIIVTFIIYTCVLGKPWTANFWLSLDNLTYHVIMPVLFGVDFFLFTEHKTLTLVDFAKTLITPSVYFCFVMILGACIPGFKYPYFFFDPARSGYGTVFLWLLLLAGSYTFLSIMLWLYDKLVKIDGKWKLDFSEVGKKRKKAVAAAEQTEQPLAENAEANDSSVADTATTDKDEAIQEADTPENKE